MEAFIPQVMDKYIVKGFPSDSEELNGIITDLRKEAIPSNVIMDNPLVSGYKILNPAIYYTDNIMFHVDFSGQIVQIKPNERQISVIKDVVQKFKKIDGTNKPTEEFWHRWNSYPNLKNIREWFNQLPLLFNITTIGKALVAAYVAGKIPSLKLPC